MERALNRFQHRDMRRLTGRQIRQWGEVSWEYIPLAVAMEEAGFEEIRVYVTMSQNTVAQYIETQPILVLCDRSVQRPGAWVYQRRWEQVGLNLDLAK